LFSLFAAPPERDLEWTTRALTAHTGSSTGSGRCVQVSRPDQERTACGTEAKGDPLYRKTHLTIKKVTEDIEREFHFNTAIARSWSW